MHLARPGASLTERDGPLDLTDLVIDAYGPKGRALGILPLMDGADPPAVIMVGNEPRVATISHRDPLNPGKEFLVR